MNITDKEKIIISKMKELNSLVGKNLNIRFSELSRMTGIQTGSLSKIVENLINKGILKDKKIYHGWRAVRFFWLSDENA